jgi:hypothetical protein
MVRDANLPAFYRVFQVIELIDKSRRHKGFSRVVERLQRLYEISEKRVRNEPFASSEG